jgi:serine/threonine protein phosphatase PrpC
MHAASPSSVSPGVVVDAARSTTPRLEVAAATHVGPRRTNADAYVIDEAAGFLAVADGVGDTPRSRFVAQMALAAVRELFGVPWSLLPPAERAAGHAAERLVLGVLQANGRLRTQRRTERQTTATTFAGVVVCGDRICVGHAGDSRVYLLRAATGRLTKLTEDHTILNDALWRGVPYDVAVELADARALTRAIGTRYVLEIRPLVTWWAPGDVVLMCTDGVSDEVDVAAITRTLSSCGELGDAAQRLVELANEAGGRDNATVVCARWAYLDEPPVQQQGRPG